MLSKRIAGANVDLGAPHGWDPKTHGVCASLWVRVTPYAPPDIVMLESAWEPTPHELAWLNAGGQLVLRVIGCQPPVALYVEPPPDARG